MPIRIKQAAALIGVSKQTLAKLEAEGLIQPLRSRGGHRYFTPEILEAARRAYWPANPKIHTPRLKREPVSV
jgi:predicted site-specific integrase-resolvase